MNEEAVRLALSWNPPVVPVSCPRQDILPRKRAVRLILPYTSRWKGLAGKLTKLSESWASMFTEFGFSFAVTVTFRKGGRPLLQSVRLPVSPDLLVFREVSDVN